MTSNTPSEEALLKQEREKIVADLKEQGTMIGQAAVRTLLRTGTVHLIGRKVAPQIFSRFGKTYAIVLLIDMLRVPRLKAMPKPVKGSEPDTVRNMTDVLDKSSFDRLKATTFRSERPKETTGYVKGHRWFVVGEKDSTGSANIIELHVFDGVGWTPTPLSKITSLD